MVSNEIPHVRILRPSELCGRTFPIESGTCFIGRQRSNNIVLQDSLVSRKHAQILYDGDSAVIEDLGSKNPIRVNGDNVKSHTLTHGDRLQIGQTELVFEYPGQEPVHQLQVVSDDGNFEEGVGNISVNTETLSFEPVDLQSLNAEKIYGRLSRLYRFSEELLSFEDEDSLFDVLLTMATQETAAERGFLGLATVDDGGNFASLNVVKFWDPVEGERAQSIQMSETIFNHIIRQQAAVLVRDLPKRQDFGMSVIDLQIRSFICAPMIRGDKFLGLVYVDTRSQRDQFERSDLEFVSALARLAGVALESHRSQLMLEKENERLRKAGNTSGAAVVGNHPKMVEIFRIIEKVASRDTSVLIMGENGTGKELIARAFHDRSDRKDEVFVAVNCGAIPPNLVESELFGYEKGAFTGANQLTLGKFELANGGTLFLDEIGDMPLDMQVKILRALQERRFYRVGGKEEIGVDIRVISATNQDLPKQIEDGDFREDLYFRIAVVTIEVPPLKERGEDILTIARQFVNSYSGDDVTMTKAAEECLLNYHWPGNIRELRNVLEQGMILGDGKKITPQDLPPNISRTSRGKLSFQLKSLADMEKQYIYRALEETGGNKARAASILQISRETLYQKLKQYEKDGK